jgi:endonuclease YncB( thermonuclease family)
MQTAIKNLARFSPIQALRLIGMAGVLTIASAPMTHAEEAAGAASCGLETFAMGSVVSVSDGRTFLLDDGREIRLAAIEVPQLPRPEDRKTPRTAGEAAKTALDKLLVGNKVVLKRLGPASDRYGHLVAHVFVDREGSERWIERDMIAVGQARLGARVGDPACAVALLAAEKPAREAKLGLWGDPYYALRRADKAPELLASQGRFTVVEGKVLSVREVGATIYVNFGRVWSRNLTVTILKRNARAFARAGIEPKGLEGRRIRVRGWIEERGGPRMEATHPEQLEIADQD